MTPLSTIRARISGALEANAEAIQVASDDDLRRAVDSMQEDEPTWYILLADRASTTMWNGGHKAASRKLRIEVSP